MMRFRSRPRRESPSASVTRDMPNGEGNIRSKSDAAEVKQMRTHPGGVILLVSTLDVCIQWVQERSEKALFSN